MREKLELRSKKVTTDDQLLITGEEFDQISELGLRMWAIEQAIIGASGGKWVEDAKLFVAYVKGTKGGILNGD